MAQVGHPHKNLVPHCMSCIDYPLISYWDDHIGTSAWSVNALSLAFSDYFGDGHLDILGVCHGDLVDHGHLNERGH